MNQWGPPPHFEPTFAHMKLRWVSAPPTPKEEKKMAFEFNQPNQDYFQQVFESQMEPIYHPRFSYVTPNSPSQFEKEPSDPLDTSSDLDSSHTSHLSFIDLPEEQIDELIYIKKPLITLEYLMTKDAK